MPVEIKVSGDAFRTKVRQALDLWVKVRPVEARRFVQLCKDYKERDSVRTEKDLIPAMTLPSWPVEILRQSEFATNFQYGVSCGTGNRLWDADQGLQDIFLSEMPVASISGKIGAPKKRGWA